MSVETKATKEAIHDMLEARIKTVESKLDTLKARAETAKATAEIKAIAELASRRIQLRQSSKNSGKASDPTWSMQRSRSSPWLWNSKKRSRTSKQKHTRTEAANAAPFWTAARGVPCLTTTDLRKERQCWIDHFCNISNDPRDGSPMGLVSGLWHRTGSSGTCRDDPVIFHDSCVDVVHWMAADFRRS